jgi:CheY-like chemotaxis protein
MLRDADVERPLEGRAILVVEDVADIRDLFATLLRMEGADVATAGSGQEALAAAAGRDYDVMLTDLGLPDIPGEVVIQTVLAAGRRRPRVIVVTGFGEPHVGRARRAGADAVLTKPVPWNRVLEQIRLSSPERVAA